MVIKLDEASFIHLHETKKFLQSIVPCTVCATVSNCAFELYSRKTAFILFAEMLCFQSECELLVYIVSH